MRIRNRGGSPGVGCPAAGQIEEQMKSAGLFVFLRWRDSVKPLTETRKGCVLGRGVGGWSGDTEESGGRTSSQGHRTGILKGGGGGRGCIDRGFLGWGGRDLKKLETDCFCWTGFQSMSLGSDMETIATIRGMDHKKSGEEAEGSSYLP